VSVEPKAIAELVEEFVNDEHRDAGKWENRTPLDESGVFSLHRMAADIYAAGFEEGVRVEEARQRGKRERKFDADRAALEPTP